MMSTRGVIVGLLLVCIVSVLIEIVSASEKLEPDVFNSLMRDIEALKAQDDGTKDMTQLAGFKAGLAAYETLKTMMRNNRLTGEQEKAYFQLKTGQRPSLVDKLDEQLQVSTVIQLGIFDNNRSRVCECAPNCEPSNFDGFQRLLDAYEYLVDARKGSYLSRAMSAKIDQSFRLYEECKGIEELKKHI